MKKIYTYIIMLAALLVVSCQQEELVSTPTLQPGEFQFSVTLPEPMAVSRAMGDKPQDVTSMPMHVLVFDENGFYVANQLATVVSFDDANQHGSYNVALPKSDGKAILHFVLGDVDYGTYAPTESEVDIFSSLTVSDGRDAYWQRVKVDGGINENTRLPQVDLVRNFAKVDVRVGEGNNEGFELLGFTIVNETNAGTVAPYTGSGFATFDLGVSEDDVYTRFCDLNNGFGGNTAGSVIGEVPTDDEFTTGPKYVYERNQDEATRPAYVLLKAKYGKIEGYYKLDIVRTDKNTWLTPYLNLYRNFAYTVVIGNVSGAGYATKEEAMRAVASNNISSSVEVSQVNRISDGRGNELSVDRLEVMLVTTDTYELGYEYIEQNRPANEKVKIVPVEKNTSDGWNHNAVQSIEADGNGNIIIRPADPLPDILAKQEFVLTTESGLSRRVKVYVRKPFEFAAVDCDDQVERTIGSELSVVVRLPDNMPTAVFPLTIDIEPEKKSIYPDASKNRIPVVTEGDYTFKYQTTVTYNDYRQNRTLFLHFKTNMQDSETSITVSNPYFHPTENQDNMCEFTNADKVYGFEDVKLNGVSECYHFDTYQTKGKEATLTFRMPCGSELHTNGSSPIEIYADYFDLANAYTETGTFELRSDGQCIFYTPFDATPDAEQSITFTVTQDYASETVQLSALDHKTATIDYTTPSLDLTVKYRYNAGSSWRPDWQEATVPNRTVVRIYKDAGYTELVAEKTANRSGVITMDTFVGFTGTDNIYFQVGIEERWSTTTYRGHKTVVDLISQKEITLEEAN